MATTEPVRGKASVTVIVSLVAALVACGPPSTNTTVAGGPAGSEAAGDGSAGKTDIAGAAPMTEAEKSAYRGRHGVGFEGTDTNGDGRVTMAEANAYARGPLTSGGDTDKDGSMSAVELAAAAPEVRAQLLRRDADGDGAVSSAEIDARVDRVFQAADTDRDGVMTKQEFQAAASGSR